MYSLLKRLCHVNTLQAPVPPSSTELINSGILMGRLSLFLYSNISLRSTITF